jgi:hypothetical protein
MEYDIVGDYDDEKGEYLYLLKIGDKEYQYRGIDKQKRMLSDEKKLKGKGIYKMWKPTPMTEEEEGHNEGVKADCANPK